MGGGGFLLTKVNARADERRRAGLRRRGFWVAICWVAVGCMAVEDWG